MAGLTSPPTSPDGRPDAVAVPPDVTLRATDAAPRLSRWGFLAHPDLPDAPGPAFLLVALRPAPTLMHYDPEAVDYWVTDHGRGARQTLGHGSTMPRSEEFSWGLIRLVDRLGVSNEYLTFGGHLDAAAVDDVVVAAFASPAPLLRRGGHSQGWDPGADAVGAFFARLMVAVDFVPGFESMLAATPPLSHYAAFVHDAAARLPALAARPWADEELCRLLRAERSRLRTLAPDDWARGGDLLAAAFEADLRTGSTVDDSVPTAGPAVPADPAGKISRDPGIDT